MEPDEKEDLEAMREITQDLELRIVELEEVVSILERRLDKLAGKQEG